MGKAASTRVEGKYYFVIPGEVDGSGEPVYHCKAPGCTYTCKNPSGIRLHWLKKHKELDPAAVVNATAPARQPAQKSADSTAGKPTGTAAVMVQAERGLKKCPVCGGLVALLKSSDLRHARAIRQGWTRYCTKCEEVFK